MRAAVSHILKPRSGAQYANLVPSRVYCSTQNRSAQMAGIDVKETYRVSRAVPKSDESVARGMLNQGMRGPSHGTEGPGTGVVDLTTASGRILARLQQ